jgi:hypothetical protein
MKNMKTIKFALLTLLVIVSASSCKRKQISIKDDLIPSKYMNNPATMVFDTTMYDFGTIKQGDKAKYQFKFTNTSKNDLLIVKGYGSCGCTVPSYPKAPVKPGESAVIDVQFNSAHKVGKQHKKIVLEANTASENFLYIDADVVLTDSTMQKEISGK